MIKNKLYSSGEEITLSIGHTYILKDDEVLINDAIYKKIDVEIAMNGNSSSAEQINVLLGVNKRDGILNIPAVEVNYLEWLVDNTIQTSLGECIENIAVALAIQTLSQEVLDFIERVENDGGTIVSPECIQDPITADFHFDPSGYKAGVAYVQRPEVTLADNLSVIYTLKQPFVEGELFGDAIPWTQLVLQVRRSSDNSVTEVYFDSNGNISLNSLVFIGGTLGNWVGSDDAYIRQWFGITKDNILNSSYYAVQTNFSRQPKLIDNGGVVKLKGSAGIDF